MKNENEGSGGAAEDEGDTVIGDARLGRTYGRRPHG